jgi:hypothetical protein
MMVTNGNSMGKTGAEKLELLSQKGNDIEQTANTYNLNGFNKVIIKISEANLSN